jgi:hypothetical protein
MDEKRKQAYPYWMVFFAGIAIALIAILLPPNWGRSAFNIDDGFAKESLSMLEFWVLIGGFSMAFYGLAAWIHAPRLTAAEGIARQRRNLIRILVFVGICSAVATLVATPPFTFVVIPWMVILTFTNIYPGLVFPLAMLLTIITIVAVFFTAMFYYSRQHQPTEAEA